MIILKCAIPVVCMNNRYRGVVNNTTRMTCYVIVVVVVLLTTPLYPLLAYDAQKFGKQLLNIPALPPSPPPQDGGCRLLRNFIYLAT